MADTQVLGTCVFGREGSSPFSRTLISLIAYYAEIYGKTISSKN